jgi:hypothetical protein
MAVEAVQPVAYADTAVLRTLILARATVAAPPVVKSTRSTVIVEPGVVEVALGVALGFCTKAVVLTLE